MIREFTDFIFVLSFTLMAQALEGGAVQKTPWYEPTDSMPKEPIIDSGPQPEFDSLVVETPNTPVNEPIALRTTGSREKRTET